MSYQIRLSKESFKFSGTHFTIFSAQSGERLHGHNYYVRVKIDVQEVDKKLGMAFDFNLVKPLVKNLCDQLDEYILVPTRSPHLKIKKDHSQMTLQFQEKTYSFPLADTRELPLVNITSEELARYLAEQLVAQLKDTIKFISLSVEVEETNGQSASFKIQF